MRNVLWTVVTLSLLAAPAIVVGQDATPLKTERDKQSYAVGMQIATNFKQQGVDLDGNLVAQGMRDVLAGGKLLLTETEAKETVIAFQKEMMAKQQEAAKAAGEKAKVESETFLTANAKKEGVQVLPSGLQYKILTKGEGPKPKSTDTVTVHYRGTLIDGTEFDSSYARKEPATFPVTGVIPGWTEALQLMPVGSKWELYIPANLAYGAQGAGGRIPPNAALIFQVELLGIK